MSRLRSKLGENINMETKYLILTIIFLNLALVATKNKKMRAFILGSMLSVASLAMFGYLG